MNGAAPQIERDEQMLGEAAEMDLAFAKAVFQRGMAAEDNQEMILLGRIQSALLRSMRQSIALRDKLQRDRRQEARANPPPPPPRDVVRIARRKQALRGALHRVIFHEREGEDLDDLCWLLEENLERKRLPDDWGSEPLDEQVMRFCAAFELDLDIAEKWRDLPEVSHVPYEDDDPRFEPAPEPTPEPMKPEPAVAEPAVAEPVMAEPGWRSSA